MTAPDGVTSVLLCATPVRKSGRVTVGESGLLAAPVLALLQRHGVEEARRTWPSLTVDELVVLSRLVADLRREEEDAAEDPAPASASAPWTVTLCWTPDQNGGGVSVYPHRAPLFAVLGQLAAGEDPDVVAEDYHLTAAEVRVLDRLRCDSAVREAMGATAVDGDLLADVIADACPLEVTVEAARGTAERALVALAAIPGVVVTRGPDSAPWTPDGPEAGQ